MRHAIFHGDGLHAGIALVEVFPCPFRQQFRSPGGMFSRPAAPLTLFFCHVPTFIYNISSSFLHFFKLEKSFFRLFHNIIIDNWKNSFQIATTFNEGAELPAGNQESAAFLPCPDASGPASTAHIPD